MSECFKQTIEQVKNILDIIQDCVRRDKYIVSNNENRRENVEFFHRYNNSYEELSGRVPV